MNKIEKHLSAKTNRAIFHRRNATWAKRNESNLACMARHALLATIRHDAMPVILATRRAQDLLDSIGVVKSLYLGQDNERACRMAAGSVSKYSATYRTGQNDSADLASENEPFNAFACGMDKAESESITPRLV